MLLGKSASEILLELQATKTLDDLSRVVGRTAASLGFTGYTFVHVNPETGISTIDQRPEEWQKRYNEKGYAEKDPLILETMGRIKSFIWGDKLNPQLPEQRRILAEGSEFGIRDGYMIPIKTATREKAYLSFYSDRPKVVADIVQANKLGLDVFALMMYSTYLQKLDRPLKVITLTVRERECLLWAARGKTVADTASIMEISENTVKTHIKHSAAKLGAVNKTQAVVRAIHLQLVGV